MDYSLLIGIDEAGRYKSTSPDNFCHRILSKDGQEIYRLGIIDYLGTWDIVKKLESMLKGFTNEKVNNLA